MTCDKCKVMQLHGTRKPCEGIGVVHECPRKIKKSDGRIVNEVKQFPDNKNNRKFVRLWPQFQSGISTGFGFDWGNLETIMGFYDIPRGQHRVIFEKCLIMLTVKDEYKAASQN